MSDDSRPIRRVDRDDELIAKLTGKSHRPADAVAVDDEHIPADAPSEPKPLLYWMWLVAGALVAFTVIIAFVSGFMMWLLLLLAVAATIIGFRTIKSKIDYDQEVYQNGHA